jgi:hypothetical protein
LITLPRYDLRVILILFLFAPIMFASGAPESRLGHRMFYNPVREKIMLVGGASWDSGDAFYDDVWEFDQETMIWYEVQTSNAPPGRFNAMVTYIPERHELFMFGGLSRDDRVSDTWILDLETMDWTELSPENHPSPRSDSSVSFDPENDVVILFSGYRLDEVKTRQTWVYRFDEENWFEVLPENPPLHQYGHYMRYVPETGQHLMFQGHWSIVSGGTTTSHGFGGNIWEYKYPENEWVEYTIGSSPPDRYWGNVVYDPDENRVVMFGGHGARDYDDTWSFDVDRMMWESASQVDKPSPRSSSHMAYDPVNKVFVLFGGFDGDGGSLSDTWILDAETMQWTEVVEQLESVDDPVQNFTGAIPGFPLWSITVAFAGFYMASKRHSY